MPAVQVVRAVAGHDQQPLVAQPGQQEGHQIPGGRVGPVQVLDDQQHAPLFGQLAEQGEQGVEQL